MMNIIHIAVANLSLGAALPTPPVAYVSAGDRLMVVDPAMGRIEAVIELPASDGFPPAVSPDGAFVYVPSGGSTVEEGSVYVIDAATNTLDAEIEAGIRPVAVAFTPDGAFAYVANQWESSVSVVDTATLDVVATVRVGFLPSSIAMAPDGTFAYVANLGPGGLGAPGAVDTVSVIDTSTNTVEAVIDVSPIPVDVAITPDGSRAYVLSTLFDEFSLIDTATHEVDETFPLGDGRRVIFSPDGELAYLLGYEMISVIRTETNTIEAAIPENGCDMALTPDGRFLYVQDYTFETGDLVVYDTATLTPVETVSDIGGCGIAIAAKPPSIDVDIDIKPGGSGNSVNPKSQQRIPVAILTTQSFDAVHVDPASVVFGPGAAREAHGRGHVEDVDRDGDPDLLLHFDVRDAGILCGDTRAALHGETFDGLDVSGSDSIRTVSCK